MKVIQLKFTVPSTDTDALYSFFKRAIPFYESPGNIHVHLLCNSLNPRQFIEVVEYESIDAFQQDQLRVEHDAEMQAYLQDWRSLLTGEVNIEVFEDVTHHISQHGEEIECKNR